MSKFFISLSVLSIVFGGEVALSESPGFAMDYRVHLDAGKEDCYYQYVHPGATIYTSINVLKGGDGQAGFAVRNPQGSFVLPYAWKSHAEHKETSKQGGYYAICLDNQFSKMAPKLINLYITTFRNDLWEKHTKEMQKNDLHVENVTAAFTTVTGRVNNMLQYQSMSRGREARHYQLLLDNNLWVQRWSIGLCVALVVASVSQVVILRRLLGDGKTSQNSAPRTRVGLV